MSDTIKNLDNELVYRHDELEAVARASLKRQMCSDAILFLTGPLGAGKTTLTQALLRSLKVTGDITSPTFSYVQTYQYGDGNVCHHFDLYRLSSLEEFLQMGFDDYLRQDALIIVEWPGIIEQFCKKRWPQRLLHVKLAYDDASLDVRKIKVSS